MATASSPTSGNIETLKNRYDVAICCSRCIAPIPDRPKGEYFLIKERIGDSGTFFTKHINCDRSWIVFKEKDKETWYRIRPLTSKPGPSGMYGICEYAIDEGAYVVEKSDCPYGEKCVFAHNDVECNVWTDMHQMELDYTALHRAVLEDLMSLGEIEAPFVGEDYTIPGDGSIAVASGIPADAVRPGFKYEPLDLRFTSGTKVLLKIRATSIDGPNRFFFQVMDNIEPLEKCWRAINVFYNGESGDDYKMKPEDLQKGLAVAFRLKTSAGNSYWRRGELIDFLWVTEHDIMQVRDVDFGPLHYVKSPDLRLLSNKFFPFKRQAVEATLAYVTPMNSDHWSKEALEFTKSFLLKPSLVAEPVGMLDSKLAITVGDISDTTRIDYLQAALVRNRFASRYFKTKPIPFEGTEFGEK